MTHHQPPKRLGEYARAARYRLWRQQRGRCAYCDQPCAYFGTHRPTWPKYPRNEATLDHVIPRAHGGAWDPLSNCVVACRACNQERGTQDARLFLFTKQGILPAAASFVRS